MRWLAASAALLAIGGAAPCLAQAAPAAAGAATAELDPRNLALAAEIIDISYPPETRHALLARTTDTMMAQARAAAIESFAERPDEAMIQIMDRHLGRVRERSDALIDEGSPTIFAAFVRAYARRFTYEELVQIRAFVATPAGARFVQQVDDLISDPDVARANTAYMANVFAALQPLQVQMFEELRAYFQSRSRNATHPPAS